MPISLINRECEGQLSLFDIGEIQGENKLDKYLVEVILDGTGVRGGKEKIFQLYQLPITKAERAKRIKDIYGVGGASWKSSKPLGLNSREASSEGLEIRYTEESVDYYHTYSWGEVEKAIHLAVLTNKYLGVEN